MAWTWTGGAGTSDWNNPSNWSATGGDMGYPTNTGSGTVYIAGGSTVSIPANEQISYLYTTGSGTVNLVGAYTVQINTLVSVSAGSTLNLGATTVLNITGNLSVTGTGIATIVGGTVDTNGNTVAVNAGQTLVFAGESNLIFSGTTGTGTIELNGASVTFNYGGPTATVYYAPVAPGGMPNVLNIPNYASGVKIENFGFGDYIKAGGDALKLVLNSDGTTYSLLDSSVGYTDVLAPSVTLAPDVFKSGSPAAMSSALPSTIVLAHNAANQYYLPCFYPGTLLATVDGEIAVEHVAAGTMLKTAGGEILPVRWVGWSEVSMRFADPLRSLPIRIKAGALADGVPARDLLVSPDHALYIDGVLVQAGAMVNGVTILRDENVPESFRYYHVELATHEVLLADGCPAESFVDNVDRMNFHNWDERVAPTEPVREMDCPRAKSARQLPASLRATLDQRAAIMATAA